MERFILAEDADVDMPSGKRHLDADTPVAFHARAWSTPGSRAS